MAKFTDSDIQSTGAFLVGELERLDQTLYEPISDFTWTRDIKLRTDVTIADEFTSFLTNAYLGGFGGTGQGGKSWVSQMDNTPATVDVKYDKVTHPMTLWGTLLRYNIFELQRSLAVNRPIDAQKHEAIRVKHNLDIEEQVYVGDEETKAEGLLNSSQVTQANIGTITDDSTPKQILDQINSVLDAAWKNTSYIRVPNRLLVPPSLFSRLNSTQLPNTAMSLLTFIQNNSLTKANGLDLDIRSCRWLENTKYFTDKRIVAYTNELDVVRLPLVQMQNLPVQYIGFEQVVPYYASIGQVEFVRPEMVYYGILK